jgi:hypothetical protein
MISVRFVSKPHTAPEVTKYSFTQQASLHQIFVQNKILLWYSQHNNTFLSLRQIVKVDHYECMCVCVCACVYVRVCAFCAFIMQNNSH